MTVILDTDLLTIRQERSQPAYDILVARLARLPSEEIFATVVSFQEQAQGWLGHINGSKNDSQLLNGYRRLEQFQRYYAGLNILPFDQSALHRFTSLRSQRVRIGTMDLRIASIALTTGATLLSRNLRDHRMVPGLIVEDWTQPASPSPASS